MTHLDLAWRVPELVLDVQPDVDPLATLTTLSAGEVVRAVSFIGAEIVTEVA